jgi:lysophospholipase L1-like esterase
MNHQAPPTIFLGDSLTAGNNWSRAFPGLKLRNLGVDGDTCAGVWGRLDEVIRLAPDKIFLQIGINDFLRGASPEDIVTGHTRIWGELSTRLPLTRLRVVSLLPYLESALPGLPPNLDLIDINATLAEEAQKRGLDFIDLFRALADEDHQVRLDYTSDGLHLLPAGYQVWAERLRPILEVTADARP